MPIESLEARKELEPVTDNGRAQRRAAETRSFSLSPAVAMTEAPANATVASIDYSA